MISLACWRKAFMPPLLLARGRIQENEAPFLSSSRLSHVRGIVLESCVLGAVQGRQAGRTTPALCAVGSCRLAPAGLPKSRTSEPWRLAVESPRILRRDT